MAEIKNYIGNHLDRLTARQIEDQHFTSRRWRLGYDETEVDDFLDECADTVAQHVRDIGEIRTLCQDRVARGRTMGERALAGAILMIIDGAPLLAPDAPPKEVPPSGFGGPPEDAQL